MAERIGLFGRLGLGLSTFLAIYLALSVLPAGLGGLALWPFIFFCWAAVNRLIVFMSEGSEVDFETWKQRRRDAGIPVPQDLLPSPRVLPRATYEENCEAISRILNEGEGGSVRHRSASTGRTSSGGGEFDPDERDFAYLFRSGPL